MTEQTETQETDDYESALRRSIQAFAIAIADTTPDEPATGSRRRGTKRNVLIEAIAGAGDLLRMHKAEMGTMGDVPGRPPFGTPEFARWLNGPITRFCGHGYHQGTDHALVCRGTVETLGIKSPCECECHRAGAANEGS